MEQSQQINELAAALSKAQAKIQGAKKDSANPFFDSKYADLAAVWHAIREPFTENGLALIQSPEMEGDQVKIVTLLTHSSGQWVKGELKLTPGWTDKSGEFHLLKDPQAIGSATTYGRRYSASGFAGVAPEDDDGNGASGKGYQGQEKQTPKTWREEICHVGSKAKGKPLSKLDNAQIGALHEYMSDPKNQTTKQDKSLLAALSIAIAELGLTPKKAPPADYIPIDVKKQLLDLIEFNGYTGDDLISLARKSKWTTASFYDDITEAEAAEMFKNSDTVLDAIKTMKGAK